MKSNRLRGGIVILLLALAFVDLTLIDLISPQLCNDELLGPALLHSAESAEQRVAVLQQTSQNDSEPGRGSQSPVTDEDCFCCCSHIIPSYSIDVIEPVSGPRINLLLTGALPSPPPQDTFHPPRHA